ncbi:hypothetical protein ACLB2K_013347 [Fragaria x ananassa]
MNREWILKQDKFSTEYKEGVRSFMEVAKHHVNERNETICPCKDCLNKRWQPLHVTRVHLLHRGMSIAYLKWTDHGEQGDTVTSEVDEQVDEPTGDLFGMIRDLFPSMNAGSQHAVMDEDDPMMDVDDDDSEDEDEVIEYNNDYEKLLLEAQRELYPGCKEHTGFRRKEAAVISGLPLAFRSLPRQSISVERKENRQTDQRLTSPVKDLATVGVLLGEREEMSRACGPDSSGMQLWTRGNGLLSPSSSFSPPCRLGICWAFT